MIFCLDFEATQFSQKIISIGCVAGNGNTFSTLVNPKTKDKITKFITRLTGITKEMVMNAPDPDTAFNDFFDFICENSDDEPPIYYCYGNADADFLKNTIKSMTDIRAITCAQAICSALVDYSEEVKNYFSCSYAISLKKVCSLIKDEQVVQNHDALEDAQMLQTVVSSMKEKCQPEDKEKLDAMVMTRQADLYPPRKRAPAIFQSWNGIGMWKANTLGTEEDWGIRCITSDNRKVKYFDNEYTAALWIIKYFHIRGMSSKRESDVNKIKARIKNSINTKKPYFGMKWEKKGE